MTDDSKIIADIITCCMEIDAKAIDIYERFIGHTEGDDELRIFWITLHKQKKGSLAYWEKLLTLAENDEVPKLTENIHEVKNEMTLVLDQCEETILGVNDFKDVENAFSLAAQFEFYRLYSSVTHLLNFLSTAFRPESENDDFVGSAINFIEMFNKYAKTPTMKALGGMLQQLVKGDITRLYSQNYDYLTGLFNQKGFFQSIMPLTFLAQRNKFNVGIMMIDIDDLARVNTEATYQEGNKLIMFVGKFIKRNMRRADLISRYGPNRFIVYLSNMSQNSLFYICERIRSGVEKESKKLRRISVSVGAVEGFFMVKVYDELKDLIRKAEDCLDHAKRKGKNRVVVNYKL